MFGNKTSVQKRFKDVHCDLKTIWLIQPRKTLFRLVLFRLLFRMKINNKILGKKVEPLTQEQFEEQKGILKINNTYDDYSRRQDIPLFIYITNDPNQFENWSAIRIFEWWRNLRMSGISKREWPIFDSVKYLFINQFMNPNRNMFNYFTLFIINNCNIIIGGIGYIGKFTSHYN